MGWVGGGLEDHRQNPPLEVAGFVDLLTGRRHERIERQAVGQVAARGDGAKLAFDKAQQRAMVVVAAGDELVAVVPHPARESTGLRVPWPPVAQNDQTQDRGAGVMEVACLEIAHAPHLSTRHKALMDRSVGGLTFDLTNAWR